MCQERAFDLFAQPPSSKAEGASQGSPLVRPIMGADSSDSVDGAAVLCRCSWVKASSCREAMLELQRAERGRLQLANSLGTSTGELR